MSERPGAPAASSASTAAAVSAPACGRRPGSSPTTIRVPVANASIRAVGGVSPWTSRSWLPSAGYQGARRPGDRNGRAARGEQPRMARRVEVGAVEERVGVAGLLHALVAGRARVGVDRRRRRARRAPGRARLRVGVEQVAGDDGRVGREPVRRPHGRGEHLRAERLLRPERRAERRRRAGRGTARARATPRRARGGR